MNTLILIARWVGIIPAVILGCALTFIFFKFSLGFFADNDSFYSVYIVPILCYIISGIMAIFCGAMMAPAYQKTVAIVLNIIFGIIIIISTVLYLQNHEYWNVITSLCALSGNLFGYFSVVDVLKPKV